ncbi:hypothetical protein BCR35DRAFT_301100 [Leucosporidium creatinivorum]|uniref:INO80 complex subunit F domain-containing protein n=1 Tax=Leucosporidium creatinivorum TaxID=106004 RepID=A0A1Y2FXP2_9BASI|nr:hypothetical protein BCR35DRAFT_301100 [Leucosporidium creatinivorum]
MAPAKATGPKAAFSNPLPTQADDAKYRKKYKELKAKLAEVEEDNTKLAVRILKSKKAIQRLRVERSVLYDRLQTTTTPSNPYALRTAPHLTALAASNPTPSTSNLPPTILDKPNYPLADPQAPDLFLQQLDAQKLAAVKNAEQFGGRPVEGVEGERKPDIGQGQAAVLAAGNGAPTDVMQVDGRV